MKIVFDYTSPGSVALKQDGTREISIPAEAQTPREYTWQVFGRQR